MATTELLTSTQLGALLGKSGRTVQRMADAGRIPVAQKLPGPNGAYLFRHEDVVAALGVEPHAALAGGESR